LRKTGCQGILLSGEVLFIEVDAKALNPVKTTSIHNAARMVESCATNPIRGGTIGADRPDEAGTPDLSSAGSSTRPRDDYFGRGGNNGSFFSIPIGIAGGTGPNSGRFGTLGRNTLRGPAYYDFDFALIKTTPIGHRESGLERADLQFRGELFNIFNIVNMGLPANIIAGTGFGMISKTAGTSRQIQFSLKLIY
jgi:hypothetical protein